ncbi:MAG: guanylate kinase [Oscillospiraceae bacterium]|nr:guanylate kinase [Oscillospiraceae bacterium]
MNRKFRLSVALDIDDVLLECVPHAIRLANEKYKFDPPLTIYEVDRWGKLGTRADVIFEFFNDPEFFRNQPAIKGAREFVKKLSTMTEVFVSTAVWPQYMSIRHQRIVEEFPEIPADHILMGSRKDKIDVDILFDDGMHNIFKSNATYPILMRRPWNKEATGILAVNNYDEFLKLVEVIAGSYTVRRQTHCGSEPGILVLVGPSGSGKNAVAEELMGMSDRFEKLVSYTTDQEADGKYHYVDLELFRTMQENGEIFESTTYANRCYGSRKADVEDILARGKHVLTVMDICGAMALKTHFDNVITVYVKRDKKDLLTAVLEEKMPTQEKVNRILAIDGETRNAQICDYVVQFENGRQAAEEICLTLDI